MELPNWAKLLLWKASKVFESTSNIFYWRFTSQQYIRLLNIEIPCLNVPSEIRQEVAHIHDGERGPRGDLTTTKYRQFFFLRPSYYIRSRTTRFASQMNDSIKESGKMYATENRVSKFIQIYIFLSPSFFFVLTST